MLDSFQSGRPPLVIEAPVGSGRHGHVFRATSTGGATPRPVAVKVLSNPGGAIHEADALRRFRHGNIVALAGSSPRGLVLELAEQGSLQDHLDRRGRLTDGEVSGVLGAVMDALEHIHSQGWIHGDVNPTNIGVRSDGSVMLFDFATARPADSGPLLEATPTVVGPGARAVPATDVRAAAATARACLAGPSTAAATSDAQLETIIRRIDTGEPVGAAELRAIFEDVPPAPIRPGRPGGPPGRGSTASFGPRPAPRTSAPVEGRRGGIRALAALAAGGCLIAGIVIALRGPSAPNPPSPAEPADGSTVPAEATLADHSVEWDSTAGIATVGTAGAVRWRVGRSGDLAAIGDWDCDGGMTLGVYRPASSEWFTFSSWRGGSASADPIVIGSGSRLVIRNGPGGCDLPVPVD